MKYPKTKPSIRQPKKFDMNVEYGKLLSETISILKFSSKDQAIEYAKTNDISYTVIEPKKKEFVIKSYADNFLKD